MSQTFEQNPLIQITRKTDKLKPAMCSRCGLCYTDHRSQLEEACVFVQNRYEQLEEKLHGRGRQPHTDEDMFGIFRHMYVTRMAKPIADAQWSGIVTSLARMLLERNMVDGVICVQTAPGTRWKPLPSLATTVEEVMSARGNKPSLSQNLSALEQAEAKGIKRLAFIGNGCQTHALRAIQHTLPFEKVYFIGLPCTDIVSYQKWTKFLNVVSKSPDTVVHLEFMPDYRVWMRHENGYTEKVGYFELDLNRMGSDIFPDSCMSCFDYTNSLSDITVGYLGASMPYQWVLVRTETGEELFEMLRPYLEFGDIKEKGDYHKAVRASIAMLDNPRQAPKLVAKMLTFLMKFRGLRGVNFARGVLTMKWARNLHFIRQRFPQDEGRLVPEYAKRVLKKYGM